MSFFWKLNLDTLNGLEDVWNSPFLPVPELLFLEISSAGEFFLRILVCENRLFNAINLHLSRLLLLFPKFQTSRSQKK